MIQSERLIISSLDCDSFDIGDMFEWHEDKEIRKYLHLGPFKLEYDFRLFYINLINRGQKVFIAKLKNSSDKSVVCCCRVVGNSFVWLCSPKHRNKGYTSEVISAIIQELNLQQAKAFIDSRNIASQRVAEKAGFVRNPLRHFMDNKIIYEYIYQKVN